MFIPSPVNHREDIPEAELPPHKRLCLTTLILRYEVWESSTATLRPTRGHRAVEELAPTTLEGVNARVTELVAVQEKDTQDMYAEALASREAWAHSIGLSSAVHYELQAYRTHTQMHDYRIASQKSLMMALIAQNNMPPRRSSATARAAAAARATIAAPMTVAAVEQLIKARVSAALANHETL
ncbi:hypothetical protein Tco_1225558 [Tanacetum coccineum]